MRDEDTDEMKMSDPTPGEWKIAWTGYDGASNKKLYGIATEEGKLLVKIAQGEPTRVEVVPGKLWPKIHEAWPSLTDIKCMAYASTMLRLLEKHMAKLPPHAQAEAARTVWNVKMPGLADSDTL